MRKEIVKDPRSDLYHRHHMLKNSRNSISRRQPLHKVIPRVDALVLLSRALHYSAGDDVDLFVIVWVAEVGHTVARGVGIAVFWDWRFLSIPPNQYMLQKHKRCAELTTTL